MSELTRCNWCTWQDYIHRYGEENVRIVPQKSEVIPMWMEYRATKDGPWKSVGGFCALSDHCVC